MFDNPSLTAAFICAFDAFYCLLAVLIPPLQFSKGYTKYFLAGLFFFTALGWVFAYDHKKRQNPGPHKTK